MALILKKSYRSSKSGATFVEDIEGPYITREVTIDGNQAKFIVQDFSVGVKLSLVIIKETRNEEGFWEKQGKTLVDAAGPNQLSSEASGSRTTLEETYDLVPDEKSPVLIGLGNTQKKDSDGKLIFRNKKVIPSGYKKRSEYILAKAQPLNITILEELDSYLDSIYS